MLPGANPPITEVLETIATGDQDAVDRLLPLVYDELRRLAAGYMAQESSSNTLQATAVVHEAYLKLCGNHDADWKGRTHFFSVGAQAMRRVIVDHAREQKAQKRGGAWNRVELQDDLAVATHEEEEILTLDEAIDKLGELDDRMSQIVEMRFFGGMNMQEVADVLNVSKSTVEKDWTVARAWLRRELSNEPQAPPSSAPPPHRTGQDGPA